MKRGKKVIILLIVILLIAGAASGGVYAYQKYQEENLQVEVISVANINSGWFGNPMSSSGTVLDNYSQSIYIEDKTVSEVKVEEGAEVKIGDPLLVYDTAETQLEIEMKKLELQGVKNDITLANREIDKLKKIKPASSTTNNTSTNTSTTKNSTSTSKNTTPKKSTDVIMIQVEQMEGDAYNYIDTAAKPYEGTGTADNPYRFLCTQDCYVLGSYLNQLVKNEQVAAFEIWTGNSVTEGTLVSCWTVNGLERSSVDADSRWRVSTHEKIDETADTEEEPESEEKESETPAQEPESTEEVYTAEELRKEISDKQEELRKLEIQKQGLQLDLKGLRKSKKSATVAASINGIVKTVGDPEDPPTDGSAFIEISGSEGMYIKGSISELLLDQIEVGQEITASSWDTGQEYTAEITEISEYPLDTRIYGEGNPNVSYYSFMAYIQEPGELSNGDYLDISIMQSSSEMDMNSLYIEKAYVRNEDGKSYVLKAGEDNRLVKQYVETGKTIYGSSIEIKSGLSESDRIAFPYGKTAKEGIKVKDAEGF